MSFCYKRSRQLNEEIDIFEKELGIGVNQERKLDVEMRVEQQKNVERVATVSKGPIPSKGKSKGTVPSKSRTDSQSSRTSDKRQICSQKSCYCRQEEEGRAEIVEKRPVEVKPTWDAILSRNLEFQQPTKRNKACQAEPSENTSHSCEKVGKETSYHRVLDGWCHPECFIQDLAHNRPNELFGLKSEIDKTVRKMGFRDEPQKDLNRPKIVLEYLEELSVEMLKKRLEDSESRYKNMRRRLEDTLVAQKIEIHNLKSELYSKNEEVNRLLKTKSEDGHRLETLREMEFIERVTGLDNKVKVLMERDEKCQAELDRYKTIVTNVQTELAEAKRESDMFRAKMEIYRQERDQAVVSLSVYESTFKNLKSELGQEIRCLLRPQLDLTADSCGTLDTIGREPREIATSSPNNSASQRGPITITDDRTTTTISKCGRDFKKKTKHTLPNRGSPAVADSFSNYPTSADSRKNEGDNGEALLKTLQVLGKEFKQFTENVIPLALGLDDEAHRLLVTSSSTSGLSWTDVSARSISSINSTTS